VPFPECRASDAYNKTMGPELGELALEIVKWVDDYQPGIVACEFVDAQTRRHTLIGKVPIFSTEDLDASSTYPRRGALRCTVLNRWKNADGQELVRISISEPDGEESTEELQEFVVSSDQVTHIPRGHREPNAQGVWDWVEDE
jgi:hypothetical protein